MRFEQACVTGTAACYAATPTEQALLRGRRSAAFAVRSSHVAASTLVSLGLVGKASIA